MASPSVNEQEKYEVLISYKAAGNGKDSFFSNLHAALCEKKIKSYVGFELGKIEEEVTKLETTIKIIILSKQYIDSPCCLDELVKIVECNRRVILPVFYNINPSHIFELVNAMFDDAFLEHDRDRVTKWRDALIEAANLPGWDLLTHKSEFDAIEGIVNDILRKLNHQSSGNAERLFGIESHLVKLRELLRPGCSGVRIIGLWGMGGIGKTTIAKTIFYQICSEFQGCCFLANVREESENLGLVRLQNKLLSKILQQKNLYVGTHISGNNFIRNRLRRKKVLIVLDDVNKAMQLDFLVGDPNWFGPGSRIIITTRDKHLLQNGADETYEVDGLAFKDALQLFSWNASAQEHPMEDLIDLSMKILKYAKGVPLALKVIGSFLCNRSKPEWESALSKLEKTPDVKIHNVLRVSYDGLEDDEKDIFLDIACFFKTQGMESVMKVLYGCGFSADIGISALIDKSLISVSRDKISMHDLLQEMAWEIVRQESLEEPGKRSRLFRHEDICHVITKNTGTEAVEGISLDMSKIRDVCISSDAFAKMNRLRFLQFYSSNYHGGSKSEDLTLRELYGSCYYGSYETGSHLQISKGLESISSQLIFLQWNKYPLRSLPSNFCPQNLVQLNLPHSHVEHLWDGVQDLVKLKRIDLSYSSNLIKAPDLSRALNLERMDLNGCTSLIEVPSSIQHLDKLDFLNMRDCKLVRSFPSNICLKSLKRLILSNCSSLNIFPEISLNLKELYLDGTTIEEVPSSIERLSELATLNMKNCVKLENLPDNICKLKSLRDFNLNGTSIRELPQSIQNLSVLNSLNLNDCKNLASIPNGICKLSSLRHLALYGCSKLEKLPEDLGNLDLLELEACQTAINRFPSSIICLKNLMTLSFSGCKGEYFSSFLLPPLSALQSLENLYMGDCNLLEFPTDVVHLTSLANLGLGGNNFKSIPASIKQLVELRGFDLSYCKRLQSIPELPPYLKDFRAHGCTSLERVSRTSAVFPRFLDSCSRHMFLFTNCSSLDGNARANLMADAERKIQMMAAACQKLYRGFFPTPSVTFTFPGSDIPEGFRYQSIGASVTIKLPARWHYPKFLGFAFCVVVALRECYNESHINIRCESDYQDLYCYLDGWYYQLEGKPRFDGLDILFLLYDHSLYLMAVKGEEGENEATFRFYPVTRDKKPLQGCIVKKCGVHLLFSDESKIQCWNYRNSSAIDQNNWKSMDEEEGRTNKRIRNDDCDSFGAESSGSSEMEDPKRVKETK